MNKSAYLEKLNTISWNKYSSAYGDASMIPKYLKCLLEDDEESLECAHELWCSVCHQHAFISDSSNPVFDFIIELLPTVSDTLKVELMDIFLGFARCLASKNIESWEQELLIKMKKNRGIFNSFTQNQDKYLSSMSQEIIQLITDLESKSDDV